MKVPGDSGLGGPRVVAALACVAVISVFGCRGAPPVVDLPDSMVTCDGDYDYWGAAGERVSGTDLNHSFADIWGWQDATLVKKHRVAVNARLVSFSLLPDDNCIWSYYEGGYQNWLLLWDLKSGKMIRRWSFDKDRRFGRFKPSQNGKHVAVSDLSNDGVDPRIGILSSTMDKIDWLQESEGKGAVDPVFDIAVSDDGGIILLLGDKRHLVSALSVAEKKVIWQWPAKGEMVKPAIPTVELEQRESIGSCNRAAFSPDTKTIYCATDDRCIYVLRSDNGKCIGRWPVSASGRAEWGPGITSLCVSPDGRYLAAGADPRVYILSTETGKVILVLNHQGDVKITSFSPDSKFLASYAAGQFNIWDMPAAKAEPKE
jgi:WD40 repeat protein